jgi:hypothetical protein
MMEESSTNSEVDICTAPKARVEEELGQSAEEGTIRVNQQLKTSRTVPSNRWSMIDLLSDDSVGDSSKSRRSSGSLDAQRLFLLESEQAAGCEFRRSSFSVQSLWVDGNIDGIQVSMISSVQTEVIKQCDRKTVIFSHVQIREYPYVKMYSKMN